MAAGSPRLPAPVAGCESRGRAVPLPTQLPGRCQQERAHDAQVGAQLIPRNEKHPPVNQAID